MLNDEAIREMAVQLELAAPLEGVKVRITQHGGGPDESYIVANRAGYLRLAALFLQATVSPPDAERPDVLSIDAGELFDENSDVFLNWFERREEWADSRPDDSPQHLVEWLFPIGCIAVAIVLLIFIIVGAITVFKQIF